MPTPRQHPRKPSSRSLALVPAAEPDGPGIGDLLDSLTAVVWEADPRTLELIFVSRSAEDLLGYPVRTWLESPRFLEAVLHPDDRAEVSERLRLIEAGDHVLEYRLVRADGVVVRVRDLVHVIADWQGQPRSLYGVMLLSGVTGETREPGKPQPVLRAAEPPGLDLDEALSALVPVLRTLVGSSIELRLEPRLDGARVDVAPDTLERLLVEVCLHARDAMLQGGTVTVATSVSAGAALLTVADTGLGIDAVLRARVFESLFAAPAEPRNAARGLVRAREIVTGAGGTMEVTSGPGGGTSFGISLPLAAPLAPRAAV